MINQKLGSHENERERSGKQRQKERERETRLSMIAETYSYDFPLLKFASPQDAEKLEDELRSLASPANAEEHQTLCNHTPHLSVGLGFGSGFMCSLHLHVYVSLFLCPIFVACGIAHHGERESGYYNDYE
jgi:hypothetical protein